MSTPLVGVRDGQGQGRSPQRGTFLVFEANQLSRALSPLAKPGTNINGIETESYNGGVACHCHAGPTMPTKHHIVALTRSQGRELVRVARARRFRGGGGTRGRTGPVQPTRLLEQLGMGMSMLDRVHRAWPAPGPLPDQVQLPGCQAASGAGRLPDPHLGPPPHPRQRCTRSPDPGPVGVAPCRRPRAGTLIDGQRQTQRLPATGGGQAFCNGRAGLLPAKIRGCPAGLYWHWVKSSRHPTESAANPSVIRYLRARNLYQRG